MNEFLLHLENPTVITKIHKTLLKYLVLSQKITGHATACVSCIIIISIIIIIIIIIVVVVVTIIVLNC